MPSGGHLQNWTGSLLFDITSMGLEEHRKLNVVKCGLLSAKSFLGPLHSIKRFLLFIYFAVLFAYLIPNGFVFPPLTP